MKIVSFSLWGKNSKYNRGAIRNAELARELFPDWVCRFYIGDDVPRETIGALWDVYDNRFTDVPFKQEHRATRSSPSLVWAKETDSVQTVRMFGEPCDWRGMFWRFDALNLLRVMHGEESIEAFISRDCDSRLTSREKAAVDEWLASDCGFHAMRDHPHHTVPMLGGMWGLKANAMPFLDSLIGSWPKENRWQTDQEFLMNSVWPFARHNIMCHDAGFISTYFPAHDTRPFPTPREEDGAFVGATYDENDVIDSMQLETILRVMGK